MFDINNNYENNREMTSREEWLALQKVNELESHSLSTMDPLQQLIAEEERLERENSMVEPVIS